MRDIRTSPGSVSNSDARVAPVSPPTRQQSTGVAPSSPAARATHTPYASGQIRADVRNATDAGRWRGADAARMDHSRNLASRAARWSAAHRRLVVVGWLAFVLIAF